MAIPTEPEAVGDWDLAGRARDGDESAYEELIDRYRAGVHSFIHRSVGDAGTAADLAQEVFVRAWFALDRVTPKARFSTWLFQIAVNLCRDHAKSKAGRQARANESLVRRSDDGAEIERDLPHPGVTPDADARFNELVAALDAAVARLPHDLRAAFVLGVIEGRPHKEVAAIVRATPKAVEIRIRRARQQLAESLADEGVIDPGSRKNS
jgi:RNA polymerase sigma-70 factor (ECF subfamily)